MPLSKLSVCGHEVFRKGVSHARYQLWNCETGECVAVFEHFRALDAGVQPVVLADGRIANVGRGVGTDAGSIQLWK